MADTAEKVLVLTFLTGLFACIRINVHLLLDSWFLINFQWNMAPPSTALLLFLLFSLFRFLSAFWLANVTLRLEVTAPPLALERSRQPTFAVGLGRGYFKTLSMCLVIWGCILKNTNARVKRALLDSLESPSLWTVPSSGCAASPTQGRAERDRSISGH